MSGKYEVVISLLLVFNAAFVDAGVNNHVCSAELQYKLSDFILDTARKGSGASVIHGREIHDSYGNILGYGTEIDAVMAATNRYNPLSIDEDREYIGAVLEKDGYYFYTVGVGISGEDRVVVRARIPGSYSVVAFWHTHGASAHVRQFFSNADMHLVRSYNRPLYLADFTGSLKVLSPDDKTLPIEVAAGLGLPRKRGFSRGNPVRARDGEVIKVCTVQGV